MAFAPCSTESGYVSGTTIAFGGTVGFAYSPKCLKVLAGSDRDLRGRLRCRTRWPRRRMRGVPAIDNPIVNMSDGTTASFTFPTPGFYAYLCNFHGSRRRHRAWPASSG